MNTNSMAHKYLINNVSRYLNIGLNDMDEKMDILDSSGLLYYEEPEIWQISENDALREAAYCLLNNEEIFGLNKAEFLDFLAKSLDREKQGEIIISILLADSEYASFLDKWQYFYKLREDLIKYMRKRIQLHAQKHIESMNEEFLLYQFKNPALRYH